MPMMRDLSAPDESYCTRYGAMRARAVSDVMMQRATLMQRAQRQRF